MARNRVHIDASPEEVFAVLSNPYCYPEWVVGAGGVRDHDESFPAVGSRFDATVETVLIGTVETIRAALPHLERSRGAVVTIGSIAGHMPLPGMAAYRHGFGGQPSVTTKALGAWDGMLRTIGRG